jgi:hypothetical protein
MQPAHCPLPGSGQGTVAGQTGTLEGLGVTSALSVRPTKKLPLRARGFTSMFAVPCRAITRGWLWLADDSAADLTIRNHSERGAAGMASQSMREN